MDEPGAAQTLTALRDLSCLCTQFVSPFLAVFVLAAAVPAVVVHLNLQKVSYICLKHVPLVHYCCVLISAFGLSKASKAFSFFILDCLQT